jgi:hypothetical protein
MDLGSSSARRAVRNPIWLRLEMSYQYHFATVMRSNNCFTTLDCLQLLVMAFGLKILYKMLIIV